jgi:hypothetical protein
MMVSIAAPKSEVQRCNLAAYVCCGAPQGCGAARGSRASRTSVRRAKPLTEAERNAGDAVIDESAACARESVAQGIAGLRSDRLRRGVAAFLLGIRKSGSDEYATS